MARTFRHAFNGRRNALVRAGYDCDDLDMPPRRRRSGRNHIGFSSRNEHDLDSMRDLTARIRMRVKGHRRDVRAALRRGLEPPHRCRLGYF